MCGIAGFINKDGSPASVHRLEAMCDAIIHRGPDDGGTYFDGPLGLGSRRLAIIDLSPAGHMPMESADGSLVIVYNGEIYNHEELRCELRSLGHAFRSRTDTEVILAAYSQWGEACLSRFNGMWGFALYDRRSGKLFCARDRFGVKPFHYIDLPRRFAFGSELKQLLPELDTRRAERDLVTDFLLTSSTDFDQSRSFFAGIRKLPAGHCLSFDLASGSFSLRRWYEPARIDLGGVGISELQAEFERLFSSSIELRLRSDVRVGTCLSGGLDSSVIAAFASDLHGRQGAVERFKAVTALSVDAKLDESGFAKLVVDRCGLDWIQTNPTHSDFLAHLERVMLAQEEPFPTPSMILQYFVMKAAKEAGITVLLDGQGGDELLLGYPVHRGMRLRWVLRHRGPVAAMLEFAQLRRAGTVSSLSLLKYMVGAASPSRRLTYYARRHRHLRLSTPVPSLAGSASSGIDLELMQHQDVFRNVLPQLLRFEDRNSMAWSVESRLPFLDYRLVELCLSMPMEAKIHEGWSKYVLRRVVASRLPGAVAWRRSKFGFEAPDDAWLEPHRQEMRRAVLASPLLREVTDPSLLPSAFDRLDQRSRWRLYCCALWERLHGITGLSD
jgi:asparagine synthase (glutamine-hydrolysing)